MMNKERDNLDSKLNKSYSSGVKFMDGTPD